MYRSRASAIAVCALATTLATLAWGDEVKSPDAQLSDVVIADELRTAFYQHAPVALSATVSKAVRSWCSGADRERVANSNKSTAESVGWLCAKKKLRYFRSVYVNGALGPHVLVCEDNGTSSLKYFGIDLVADVLGEGVCVRADFNGTTYEFYFDNVNDGNGAQD